MTVIESVELIKSAIKSENPQIVADVFKDKTAQEIDEIISYDNFSLIKSIINQIENEHNLESNTKIYREIIQNISEQLKDQVISSNGFGIFYAAATSGSSELFEFLIKKTNQESLRLIPDEVLSNSIGNASEYGYNKILNLIAQNLAPEKFEELVKADDYRVLGVTSDNLFAAKLFMDIARKNGELLEAIKSNPKAVAYSTNHEVIKLFIESAREVENVTASDPNFFESCLGKMLIENNCEVFWNNARRNNADILDTIFEVAGYENSRRWIQTNWQYGGYQVASK